MSTVIVPSIPSVPRSLASDARAWCSAVKYSIDMREGRIDGDNRFVSAGEVEGFIREVYSTAKGKTFIKRVANFLGEPSSDLETDIYLSDITGDGLVVISAGGQIVIANPGGLIISGDGTLLVDTGAYDDPDGEGILVGDIANGYGWAINAAGLFSWWDEMPLHAFVTEDGSGTGISWQQSTDHGLEPITSPWKIYTGDAVIGGYNYEVTATGAQLGGLFWDQSAGTLYIRGDIKNATINTGGILTVQNTGYIYIETNTANTGLLIGSLGAATGWKINATGLLGYNGTGLVHALAIANGITVGTGSIDAGDVVFGTYFGAATGVWWDNSAGKLYVKGEIVDGSISTGSMLEIDATGYIFINTSTANSGLLIGSYTTGSGWLLNGAGIFGASGTTQLHAFIISASTWQSNALVAGDFVIGQYFSANKGIYWDNDAGVLKIKGRILVGTVVGGDTFTISSSGYIFINTTTNNSGLMVGTITPSGGSGWLINSSGLFGYSASSGYFVCALSSSISWDSMTIDTGDVMIGKYNTGKGLFWDNSAGRLYLRGGLNVIGAESIVLDTTGGLDITAAVSTWSGGTININGTVVTVSAAGGLAVGGSGTITLAAGGDIVLTQHDTTASEIRWGTIAKIHASSSTTNLYITADGTIPLQVSSVNKLVIGAEVVAYADFDPNGTGRDSGDSSTNYWDYFYINHVRYKDPDTFDDFDDLALVDSIKTKTDENGDPVIGASGRPRLDMLTLPKEVTSWDDLPRSIEKNFDVLVTEQDLQDVIDGKKTIQATPKDGSKNVTIDRKFIEDRLFIDAGRFTSLLLGHAKALKAEIDALKSKLNYGGDHG